MGPSVTSAGYMYRSVLSGALCDGGRSQYSSVISVNGLYFIF